MHIEFLPVSPVFHRLKANFNRPVGTGFLPVEHAKENSFFVVIFNVNLMTMMFFQIRRNTFSHETIPFFLFSYYQLTDAFPT